MSNTMWTPERGWYDGPEVTFTTWRCEACGSRFVGTPAAATAHEHNRHDGGQTCRPARKEGRS